MKTELFYLLLAALLTGVLWIPVVIGYVTSRGPLKAIDYVVPPTSPLPDWVNRANRAHMNSIESLLPFAAVVLVASSAGVSTSITATSAVVFFYARLAHALLHIGGFSLFMARTLVFTVGWLAFMTFAVEVLRKVV